MKYKNRVTGIVIEVGSKLGGDWEPVEKPKKKTSHNKTEGKNADNVKESDA